MPRTPKKPRKTTRKKAAGPKRARTAKRGVTLAALRKLALALPATEEGTSYGTPAFPVRKKLFARLREDDTVVVKIDFDEREVWHRADPKTFFWTDHYENYPMMQVQLDRVHPTDLRELLENAWRKEAGKRLVAEYDAAR